MKRQKLYHLTLFFFFVLSVGSMQPVMAELTQQQITRTLYQATFGPTPQSRAQLESQGLNLWLENQLNYPPTLHINLYQTPFTRGAQANRENSWYQISVTSQDQLRQRTAFALSQILVVSRYGNSLSGKALGLVTYYDLLVENAFGNYRDLLYTTATHPVMGSYLSMMGSKKADNTTGSLPDENYARELMQLFTIGLYELNLDGTKKRDSAGNAIPTYSQSDVQELARSLTGWLTSDSAFTKPMRVVDWRHDDGSKAFLGSTIPSGLNADDELNLVMDILMAHDNIAPFVSKQLIQRLVTSNPTPDYVERVASVFNDNGSGTKGDLGAVVSAILTDPEALGLSTVQPIKLKEPIIVFMNFHRALGFEPIDNRYYGAVGLMNSANQGALRSRSVFNFYSPDYVPSTSFSNAGLVAPEFELLDWSVYTDVVNTMYNEIRQNGGRTHALALNEYYQLLDDHPALVSLIDQRLLGGDASTELKETLLNVLDAYKSNYVAKTKLSLAFFTVLSSQEFFVQD